MPAEAHRLQQPIGVRDRRLLRIVTVAAALAAAAVIAISVAGRGGRPPAPARSGCLDAPVAGVMGGGRITGCGTKAVALCRTYAPDYQAVAAQCAALSRHASASR